MEWLNHDPKILTQRTQRTPRRGHGGWGGALRHLEKQPGFALTQKSHHFAEGAGAVTIEVLLLDSQFGEGAA
jgi:hypothetical protein